MPTSPVIAYVTLKSTEPWTGEHIVDVVQALGGKHFHSTHLYFDEDARRIWINENFITFYIIPAGEDNFFLLNGLYNEIRIENGWFDMSEHGVISSVQKLAAKLDEAL